MTLYREFITDMPSMYPTVQQTLLEACQGGHIGALNIKKYGSFQLGNSIYHILDPPLLTSLRLIPIFHSNRGWLAFQ